MTSHAQSAPVSLPSGRFSSLSHVTVRREWRRSEPRMSVRVFVSEAPALRTLRSMAKARSASDVLRLSRLFSFSCSRTAL